MNFLLWLFVIRPYCFRNGMAYTPGANIPVTMWIDWQQANELAKERGDTGYRVVCGVYLGLKVVMSPFLLAGLVIEMMGGL